ncbi:MAG: T9SS type A sorting domain-containing protein [Sphingobacteriales bacterium]|nr:MAG: T9SS type A sorting domain-containing protein [Sphingobacteriales bacterium]
MKKHMLLFAAAATLYTTAKAQSIAYFYRETMTQSTVEPRPGTGEYLMTETRFDASGNDDNSIHFTRYDQSGGILADAVIDQKEIDDRNVDLTYLSGDKYLLTAFHRNLATGQVVIDNMIIDPNGNIAAQALLASSNQKFPNLYPMDATYDRRRRQIVVCGTASEEGRKLDAPKVAFVATFSTSLVPIAMQFYDSDNGTGQTEDYDIANRIVQNSTGDYYITGSENAKKDVGPVMAIRNMLIDPVTLVPTWSYPLSYNDGKAQEISTDMVETVGASGKKEFYTLVNSTLDNSWSIIRVDPSSGTPTVGVAESYKSYQGYGFNIALGNKSDQLVVSGMKYRAKDHSCYDQDKEATPFMATVYVSAIPASLLNHVEYNTKVGNSAYWSTSDLYQPSPGYYPLPVYYNNFADREKQLAPYSVVTPLYNPSFALNTKYLDVDPATKNGCDDIYCQYDEERFEIYRPENRESLPEAPWKRLRPREVSDLYSYYDKVDCQSGYYRSDNTTSVNELEASSMKIYPNPATDNISIELGSSYKEVQITLYDIAGKKIATLYKGAVTAQALQLQLPAQLGAGVYMLQVNGNGKASISKVTITK